MSKVSGSYESVTRGVSEQVPQDRRPGQHHEQINMISDPVRGLSRRHGSVMQDEVRLATFNQTLWDNLLKDTENHKEVSFYVGGVEYALIYRTTPPPAGMAHDVSFGWAFNKVTGQLLPIQWNADAATAALKAGGVSAAVNVGKYLYLAGNTIVPLATVAQPYDAPANKSKLVAWVRGGAFSRKFTVTVTMNDGSSITGEYTTKPSAYPTLLDTSDIPVSDPDYQNKVNQRVAEYQSRVTAYIGEAAADIVPGNIAEKLRADLVLKGVPATVQGSTILIDNATASEVSADDDGDGSLTRAVGNEVSNIDLVSTVHYVGKVVSVRPKKNNLSDRLYLRAVPKNEGETGWAEVTWVEAAGYVMAPSTVFVQGTVVDEVLYLAGSAGGLTAIAGGAHPAYEPNDVGDDITAPLPFFFGRKIDYLGLFQDRLVVGSGSTLTFSRNGDYLNFFRQSVLTQEADDPVEMYALGSEADTITSSVPYDRNMLFIGKRFWYTVNGRTTLTPGNSAIVILGQHEGATLADPQGSSNYVFYSKFSKGVSSMHQIQIGALADSPESYEISQQLDQYLKGEPRQIVTLTAPNQVLLRTTERNTLYTYAYLDSPQGTERLFDAWSKWQWDEAIGAFIGITKKNTDLSVLTARRGMDSTGADSIFIVMDKFVLDTALSDLPYLDSLRPLSAVNAGTNDRSISGESELNGLASVVFDTKSDYGLLGSDWEDRFDLVEQYAADVSRLHVGINYPVCTSPTNPYILDRTGKAIVSGRMTLGRISVSIADSGGLIVDVETVNGTQRTQDFGGRLLGRASNLLGTQPIVTTDITAAIGRQNTACKYYLRAKRWLPLTITAIEWTGQYFSNSRRV